MHRIRVVDPSGIALLERDILRLLDGGEREQGFALTPACEDLGLAGRARPRRGARSGRA